VVGEADGTFEVLYHLDESLDFVNAGLAGGHGGRELFDGLTQEGDSFLDAFEGLFFEEFYGLVDLGDFVD